MLDILEHFTHKGVYKESFTEAVFLYIKPLGVVGH